VTVVVPSGKLAPDSGLQELIIGSSPPCITGWVKIIWISTPLGDISIASTGQEIVSACTFSADGEVGAVGERVVDSLHDVSTKGNAIKMILLSNINKENR
jgi:hypothetical protein